MAIPKKIINFLNKSKIKYKILEHKTVYTAFDKSQTLKVDPKIVGKTLILKGDRNLKVVLTPANKNLDLKKFKKLGKFKKVDFVSEKEIKKKFKGVKVGAIPPFGNLWKFQTFVEKSILKEKEVILNGGDWNFSIKINPKDLKNLIPDLVIGNIAKAK
jgi:Cys-tRNA(Pro) deacylase